MLSIEEEIALAQRLDERTPDQWYGYASPAGWSGLIDELDTQISALIPGYQVHQIKEKFGALRFYVDLMGADPEIKEKARTLIHAAEEQSLRMCESCGEPATLRKNKYQYHTVCDMHAEERGRVYRVGVKGERDDLHPG